MISTSRVLRLALLLAVGFLGACLHQEGPEDPSPVPFPTLVSVRVDRWLWAVRVYRTRTAAKDACVAGRVKVNDVVAKPATKIGPGDVVEVRRRDRTLIHVVVAAIEKRVSAAVAAECLEDFARTEEREALFQGHFEKHDTLETTYEAIVDDRGDVRSQLARFLAVAPTILTTPTLKLNSDDLRNMLEDYEALAAALRGTRYAEYFGS
jgi:ribosome-associated heat shock protein Hsp15